MINKQSLLLRNRLGANKAFFILFGLFIIALYMLFSLITKIAPLTISHTIYYCQKALSNILFTLPHFAPPLVVLMLSSLILIGLSLLVIQLSKTHLFIKTTLKNKIALPQKVVKVVRELGMVNRIDVVKNESLSSFCYGLIKPRICLSLKLVKTLNERELKAVLIHESYHLKNKDPLKILLSQIAISMFFFVPTLRDIHNYFALSKEIAADQLVTQDRCGQDIRSALMKVLNFPTPSFLGVASFANENSLEKRVEILTNHGGELRVKISRIRLFLSTMVFLSALALLNLPVYAVENSHDSHAYFICPYGDECMMTCFMGGATHKLPFSSQKQFTPANYSPDN